MKTLEASDPGGNWAGNYRYKARSVYRPTNVDEVRELILNHDKVKAVGSRHCFNGIADSRSIQISTENFKNIDIDESAMIVTLGTGIRYGDLCPELDRRGFALHNLASLPHISVVGACATATHGSGISNGNLATAVAGLEFISGMGEIVTLDRKREKRGINGSIVNLGAVGVVTKMALEIQPKFTVRQDVFQNLGVDQLKANFEQIMSLGYSVSLFTKWRGLIDQVWIKRRLDAGLPELSNDLFGATAAIDDLHPIDDISAEHCTDQMGVPGSWFERLPHFRLGFTPSSGEELQSEYFVPFNAASEAIAALELVSDLLTPYLLISEIRAIAADDLWLSPCYKRGSVAFHFTWKQNEIEINKVLPIIETALAPFEARPHWGKLFVEPPASLYDRMTDFLALAEEHDPQGKFRNEFLDRNIFRSPQ